MAVAVLVVDDEEGMRDLLSFVLTRDGLRVVTANGALDALAQFAAHKFDLVITDMMMPEMNGLELIERLRALDPAVAILMSTGYATPEVTSACRASAVQLLHKPCDLDELRLAIRRMRGEHQKPLGTPEAGGEASSLSVT